MGLLNFALAVSSIDGSASSKISEKANYFGYEEGSFPIVGVFDPHSVWKFVRKGNRRNDFKWSGLGAEPKLL